MTARKLKRKGCIAYVIDLKIQLQELLDKWFIHPSNSP